jgi:predicted ATPase
VPRQQTLLAAVTWSYDLLQPLAQVLFRRLAVSIGGWTLASAQAVCVGNDLPDGAVLDAFHNLADHSMVIMEERNGETRYRLLETLREFALGRLEACGELDVISRQHALHFLEVAEHLRPRTPQSVPEIVVALQLDRQHDNLRVALHWLISKSEAEFAMHFADRLQSYRHLRRQYVEGRRFIEAALALPDAHSSELFACLVAGVGRHSGAPYW